MIRSIRTISTLAAMTLPLAAAGAPSLTPLGDLPGGIFSSAAFAVSADGSTVGGMSKSALGDEAFRWTSAGGMFGLGDLPGHTVNSMTRGVSGDGSVVVGWSDGGAFRWTTSGGMVALGGLPGGSEINALSNAFGVSGDGSVVVGFGRNRNAHNEAFRWTSAGGMVGLGQLPGHFESIARAVSADGSIVVGHSAFLSSGEAFRWTSGGGMVGLGVLPGGSTSAAWGLSADGSTVVGFGRPSAAGIPEAFRWTSADGMVGLGYLPGGGLESYAIDANGDGTVVVGSSDFHAFRWTPERGMERLWDVLVAAGIDPAADGWFGLGEATGVSDDGKTFVGSGSRNGNIEAFIAVIPEPASLALLALGLPLLPRRRR